MLRQIGWVGALIGFLALGVGFVYLSARGVTDPTWQTMIFTSLAFMQIGQALASRSDDRSLFALGLGTNPTLLTMVGATLLLQLAAVYLPFLSGFFRIAPLAPMELLVALGLGVFVFTLLELAKWVSTRRAAPRGSDGPAA